MLNIITPQPAAETPTEVPKLMICLFGQTNAMLLYVQQPGQGEAKGYDISAETAQKLAELCIAKLAKDASCDHVLEVVKGFASGPSDNPPTFGGLPLTPRLKKAICIAIKDAKAKGHNYIGPEHLMAGITALLPGQ
jgi:hypothetical protein